MIIFIFRQPTKLSVLVDFPLYSFDMTPHLAIGRDVRVPLKPLASRRLSSLQDRNLYDLYAVCNHHGSDPHSGHYTGKSIVTVNYFSVSYKLLISNCMIFLFFFF